MCDRIRHSSAVRVWTPVATDRPSLSTTMTTSPVNKPHNVHCSRWSLLRCQSNLLERASVLRCLLRWHEHWMLDVRRKLIVH